LKRGVVLETPDGATINVGPACGATLLGWTKARVANATKKRPTLAPEVVARLALSPVAREEIAGKCTPGDCQLCGLPSEGPRVAILTADGGTVAAHVTCTARAYSKATGRRWDAYTVRTNVDCAGDPGSYRMNEFHSRNS
jgi:hypothetical protein